MPKGLGLGPGVGHEYDPNLFINTNTRAKGSSKSGAATSGNDVFHNHSSNVPHLKNWIDQLVSLTISTDSNALKKPSSSGGVQLPTTENLVQALQRYDAVYQELNRQKQAQSILDDRQKEDAAAKIAAEESELERLHLRAKIRTLEAELESMKMSKYGLERENDRMRSIIDVYINSSELQDPVFGLLNEDDMSMISVGASQSDGGGGGSVAAGSQQNDAELPRRRANAADAGRLQLRNLNRLDIELNEIMSGVLTEENRQRTLLKDLLRLFDRNRALLEGEHELIAVGGSGSMKASSGPSHYVSFSLPPSAASASASAPSTALTAAPAAAGRRSSIVPRFTDNVSKGVQADGKDDFSAVLDTDLQTAAAVNMLGVAPLAPTLLRIRGEDQPFQVRHVMQSFPKVLRIPPAAWAYNQIMSIYLDKIFMDREMERKGMSKQPLAEFTHAYFTKTAGLAACADVLTSQLFKACETQIGLPRIAVFAAQVGLADKNQPPQLDVRDTEFILLLLSKMNDCQQEQLRLQAAAQESKAAGKRRGGVLAALLSKSAGGALGSFGTTADVLRSVATNHFVQMRMKLTGGDNITNGQAAIAALQAVLKPLLPDGGEDIRAMPHTDKGVRFVDLDLVVQLALEPWRTVRSSWEEHAKFLYQQFCTVHKVIHDLSFASDDGSPAVDTLLSEVQKEASEECGRRPLRIFQKTEGQDMENAKEHRRAPAAMAAGQGAHAVTREPVVELMTREAFYAAVKLVQPYLTLHEMDSMFDEAVDISQADVLRNLEYMWVKCVEQPTVNQRGREHRAKSEDVGEFSLTGRSRVNSLDSMHSHSMHSAMSDGPSSHGRTKISTPAPREYYPYSQKTFRSQDIEIHAFVLVLIRRDLFMKSPLLEKLLHIAPREMWPNADVVHKQIRDREKARLDEASAADRRKAAQQLRASQLQIQTQQQQQQGLEPLSQKEAEEDDDDAESIEEDIATAAAPAAAPTSSGKSIGGKAGKDKDKDKDKGRESKSRTGAKRR
eukprot:gene22911-31215_t